MPHQICCRGSEVFLRSVIYEAMKLRRFQDKRGDQIGRVKPQEKNNITHEIKTLSPNLMPKYSKVQNVTWMNFHLNFCTKGNIN